MARARDELDMMQDGTFGTQSVTGTGEGGASSVIHSTEYPELSYQQQGERNWRFIDTSTGKAIGKAYPTCAALRMNIRRQALLFGCERQDVRESAICRLLDAAETCAANGDTSGILDCLEAMREVMGMEKVPGSAK